MRRYQLDSTSPIVQQSQKCPVTRQKFEVGDDVVECNNGHVFLAKSWKYLDNRCSICHHKPGAEPKLGPKTKPSTPTLPRRTPTQRSSQPLPVWITGLFYSSVVLLVCVVFAGGVFAALSSRLASPAPTASPSVIFASPAPIIKKLTLVPGLPTLTKTFQPPTTPTAIPTKILTRTPQPTATPWSASLCPQSPRGAFASLWRNYEDKLGCPLSDGINPLYGQFAEMPFEKGHIFWIGNIEIYGNFKRIVVTVGGQNEEDTGTWSIYDETWNGEEICSVPSPPEGLYLPDRGIGQIWCEINGINNLGYATASHEFVPSRGINALQIFEKAIVFRDSDGFKNGLVYVLFRDSQTYVRMRY